MKKYYSKHTHPKNIFFLIEEDEAVGFYLYVYYDFSCFSEDVEDKTYASRHQEDHLQDTLAMAQRYAKNHFDVPLDSWVEVTK